MNPYCDCEDDCLCGVIDAIACEARTRGDLALSLEICLLSRTVDLEGDPKARPADRH